MSPRDHSEKVMAKAAKKKERSPFRCDNCGATFVSEAEKHAHHRSQHAADYERHQREEQHKEQNKDPGEPDAE